MLILTYEDLPNQAKNVFEYLNESALNSKNFLDDPARVLSNLLLGKDETAKIPKFTTSTANKLLFSLLKNPDFIERGRELEKRLYNQKLEPHTEKELMIEIVVIAQKYLDTSLLNEIKDSKLAKELINIDPNLLDESTLDELDSTHFMMAAMDPNVADIAVVVTAVVAVAALAVVVALALAHEGPTLTPSRNDLNTISRIISDDLIRKAGEINL